MKKELTCIVCPMGCGITVEYDGKEIKSISGNTCKRGYEYAKNEITDPKRTITSTVRCDSKDILSVKSDRPIPKEKIADCMKIINNCVAHLPVSIGDIIIEDVFGANIVATKNLK